jgi:hypothetical protein
LHVEEIIKAGKKAEEGGGGTGSAAPDSVCVTPVPIGLVARAVAEYKEDPLMLRTAKCCQLEKAILVAMCKHAKITDTGNMTLEDVWNRLCDLLHADERALRQCSGDSLSRIGASASSSASTSATLSNSNGAGAGVGGGAGGGSEILDIPPYHMFEAALGRLCAEGVLVLTEPKLNNKMGFANRLLHECLFSTRLMPSDIVNVLNKHRYLKYL